MINYSVMQRVCCQGVAKVKNLITGDHETLKSGNLGFAIHDILNQGIIWASRDTNWASS